MRRESRVLNWISYEWLRFKARIIAWTLFFVGLIYLPKLWESLIDLTTAGVAFVMSIAATLLPYPGNWIAQKVLTFISWFRNWLSLVLLWVEPEWKPTAQAALKTFSPGGLILVTLLAVGTRWGLILREYFRKHPSAQPEPAPTKPAPRLPHIGNGPQLKIPHDSSS